MKRRPRRKWNGGKRSQQIADQIFPGGERRGFSVSTLEMDFESENFSLFSFIFELRQEWGKERRGAKRWGATVMKASGRALVRWIRLMEALEHCLSPTVFQGNPVLCSPQQWPIHACVRISSTANALHKRTSRNYHSLVTFYPRNLSFFFFSPFLFFYFFQLRSCVI